jgi:hypothetical protein
MHSLSLESRLPHGPEWQLCNGIARMEFLDEAVVQRAAESDLEVILAGLVHEVRDSEGIDAPVEIAGLQF